MGTPWRWRRPNAPERWCEIYDALCLLLEYAMLATAATCGATLIPTLTEK
jgi:hypothetical protein